MANLFNLIPDLAGFPPEPDAGPLYVLVAGESLDKLELQVNNYLEVPLRPGHWVCQGGPFCTPLGTFVQAMVFKPNKGARKPA